MKRTDDLPFATRVNVQCTVVTTHPTTPKHTATNTARSAELSRPQQVQ
jgi:hypothetical protein